MVRTLPLVWRQEVTRLVEEDELVTQLLLAVVQQGESDARSRARQAQAEQDGYKSVSERRSGVCQHAQV